jgi:hypothetical protein
MRADTPPQQRRGHEGNGSHRFEAGGSVRIGAGAGFWSLGAVKRIVVEPDPGEYPSRAGSLRCEFRQRNPAGRDSTGRNSTNIDPVYLDPANLDPANFDPANFDATRHALRAAGSRQSARGRRCAVAHEVG